MIFEYDKKQISTQDELKISVADLRDLIQIGHIVDPQQLADEYSLILRCILRKNKLHNTAIWLTQQIPESE